MFVRMQEVIKEDFARYIFHIEAVKEERSARPQRMRQERRQIPMAQMSAPETGSPDVAPDEPEELQIEQAVSDKIPRNAPCPCGSGKKYKQCHGRPGAAAL
jgi:preprotein translocase subunit SecA